MTEGNLGIDKERTALVLIDLQKGIIAREAKPYSSKTVLENSKKLLQKFRANGMPVFLVHVSLTPETSLKVKADSSISRSGELPPDWTEFAPEVSPQETDVIITKKQWGAFYGTDLELQLRRRGIDTIVLGGIATTYGVESTGRFAYEYGFQQIFVEDAMSDLSEESHKIAIEYVFKRMGRVRKTDDVLKEL